jgi:hypothetical protein
VASNGPIGPMAPNAANSPNSPNIPNAPNAAHAASTPAAPIAPTASAPSAAPTAAAPAAASSTKPVASAADPLLVTGSGPQTVNFRPTPVPTTPIQSARQANSIAIAFRPGDPAFVGVRVPTSGYLYCYMIDDQKRISQLYSASEQPLVHSAAGEVSVFAATRPAGQRAVACFSSARILGQHPVDVAGVRGGVEALRMKFAGLSGNNFEMGVFNVKYQ